MLFDLFYESLEKESIDKEALLKWIKQIKLSYPFIGQLEDFLGEKYFLDSIVNKENSPQSNQSEAPQVLSSIKPQSSSLKKDSQTQIFNKLVSLTKKQGIDSPNLSQTWLIGQFQYYLYTQGKNSAIGYDPALIKKINELSDPGLCFGFASIFCLEEGICQQNFLNKLSDCSRWDRSPESLTLTDQEGHIRPSDTAKTFEEIISLLRLAHNSKALHPDTPLRQKKTGLNSYYRKEIYTPFSSVLPNTEECIKTLFELLKTGQKIRMSALDHTIAAEKETTTVRLYDSNARGPISVGLKDAYSSIQQMLFSHTNSQEYRNFSLQKAWEQFSEFQHFTDSEQKEYNRQAREIQEEKNLSSFMSIFPYFVHPKIKKTQKVGTTNNLRHFFKKKRTISKE